LELPQEYLMRAEAHLALKIDKERPMVPARESREVVHIRRVESDDRNVLDNSPCNGKSVTCQR
jgi:hypothetical protein